MPRPWRSRPRPGSARAYGGVVVAQDGRLLLRAPAGGYGGYAWTWPKGRAEPGEPARQAAVREVCEETGVNGRIIGLLPGWFVGDTSDTQLFVMRAHGPTAPFGDETAAVVWATPARAQQLVAMSRSPQGRRRDLAVIAAMRAWLGAGSRAAGRCDAT